MPDRSVRRISASSNWLSRDLHDLLWTAKVRVPRRMRQNVSLVYMLMVVGCSSHVVRDKKLYEGQYPRPRGKIEILHSKVPDIHSSGAQPTPVTIKNVVDRSGVMAAQVDWLSDERLAVSASTSPETSEELIFGVFESSSPNSSTRETESRDEIPILSVSVATEYTRAGTIVHGQIDGSTIVSFDFLCPCATANLVIAGYSTSENRKFVSLLLLQTDTGLLDNQATSNQVYMARTPSPDYRSVDRYYLATINVDTSKVSSCTYYEGTVSNYRTSNSGDLFFVDVSVSRRRPTTTVFRYSYTASGIRKLFQTEGRLQSLVPLPSPDGRRLLVAIDKFNKYWEDFLSLVTLDAENGDLLNEITDEQTSVTGKYAWIWDGDGVAYQARNGGFDELVLVNVKAGERQVFASGAKKHYGLAVSPSSERLAYLTLDGFGRREVWVFDATSGDRYLVHTLDDPTREFELGAFSQIKWRSTDNIQPYGYLVYPPDFKPGIEYPLLVDVHGGGPGSELYLFGPLTAGVSRNSLEWHAWASLGYIVFVPDYRSSGEYSAEVVRSRRLIREFSFVKDAKDVLLGIEAVRSLPYVSDHRIVGIGHSAGGGRLLRVLAESEIISAVVINESIAPDAMGYFLSAATNWGRGGLFAPIFEAALGVTFANDKGPYLRTILPDLVRTESAILFMSGDEAAGGIDQQYMELLFSVLSSMGAETKYVTFPGEGHVYSKPESAVSAFELTAEWFDVHMPQER